MKRPEVGHYFPNERANDEWHGEVKEAIFTDGKTKGEGVERESREWIETSSMNDQYLLS